MKRILPILIAAICAISCSEGMERDNVVWDPEAQGEADTPIVFLTETDFDAFVRIVGLENRFKACEVPREILDGKTTLALAKSILHYPLNYILPAYNFLDSPVKLIYDNSPLHQALAARRDAAEALTSVFEKTSIDMNPDLNVSTSYEKIKFTDELFLEMFMGSGLVQGLDKGDVKKRLKAAVLKKMQERQAAKDYFGTYGLIPLAYMNERLGLGLSFPDDAVSEMHRFTLDTAF